MDRLVFVFLAGFLRSGDEFRVGAVGANRAAGLREESQRALFCVELQQREEVYEMKRRVEVASDGRTKGPRVAGGGGGRPITRPTRHYPRVWQPSAPLDISLGSRMM